MEKLRFGVAYYDEYMPYDRLEQDVRMMREAGINTVRIAESTWSTLEPQPGVFDFSHVDRVLDAMGRAGIDVIVGTPTYAVPAWMVRRHPGVLAQTHAGPGRYGPRQIMDITDPDYLRYAERVIRKLIGHVCGHPAVVGYQLDNETKHYDVCGERVQRRFVAWLRAQFGTTSALNAAFGLDYWSNRVDDWDDFPDVRNTINASLRGAFERFRRELVTEFLAWQASIVREYARPGQFLTHNFDFAWRNHSYGVQPAVDHKQAAQCLTVAGCDIYHPSQDGLTGMEIAFGGAITRGLLRAPYLVLETQAQGFPCWTPYPGQLFLQAMSHLAHGAHMVEYWHWHSIHNAIETYWKGLLSHDFLPGEPYREACRIGEAMRRLAPAVADLRVKSRCAILVSNDALTAVESFPIGSADEPCDYNRVFRFLHDAFYRANVPVDVLFPEDADGLDRYDLVAVPALYAAPESLLARLRDYALGGGTLLCTFKTAFSNEHVKVYPDRQPHLLADALGVSYSEFTYPCGVTLSGVGLPAEQRRVRSFMELVTPAPGAQVLCRYEHPHWGRYAAFTRNACGNGHAYYLACLTSDEALDALLPGVLADAGISLDGLPRFPLCVRTLEGEGRRARFYLNYSDDARDIRALEGGVDALTDEPVAQDAPIALDPWGVRIVLSRA